ncbi:unnamed protein product, partial [Nesidiocoris tenuis]
DYGIHNVPPRFHATRNVIQFQKANQREALQRLKLSWSRRCAARSSPNYDVLFMTWAQDPCHPWQHFAGGNVCKLRG